MLKNPDKKLTLLKKVDEVEIKERKKPKYTPLSKRQDRPDAILWLCKNASELTDGQISKRTIESLCLRRTMIINHYYCSPFIVFWCLKTACGA